jgi:hypothetical protein
MRSSIALPIYLPPTFSRRVVADAHLLLDLLGGQAEVDEELVGLRGLVVLLRRDVRGLALRLQRPLESLATRGRDEDPLRDHVRREVSAEGLEPEEALVVYVFDEKADLVGVPGDHHAHVVAATLRAYDASQGVGMDLVDQGAELLARDLALLLLASRHAGGLYQSLQECFVERHALPFRLGGYAGSLATARWRVKGAMR